MPRLSQMAATARKKRPGRRGLLSILRGNKRSNQSRSERVLRSIRDRQVEEFLESIQDLPPEDQLEKSMEYVDDLERQRQAGTPADPPPPPPYEQGAPDAPGASSPLSQEIRTPQSSNVYSFQYDYSTSTLYVRYKAPTLDGTKVRNTRSTRRRLGGIKAFGGGVITGRSNEPGPLYAYLDVPVRVFNRLKGARSAGKAVWDDLRVRGSAWGHKFRYQLIQGALVPGQDGKISTYIPRRSTKKGFRRRSITELGKGKRRYATSTLPEQIRRNGAPNRAEPNRGEPNRG